jgi:hypothetical protein
MKMVFVAGPYRGANEWEVTQNIRRAEALALELWRVGLAVICPHKNTAYFGGADRDDIWLAGGLEMVRRSDAVVCTPDWEKSIGARSEVALAEELGIPVFNNIQEVQKWLKFQDRSQSPSTDEKRLSSS